MSLGGEVMESSAWRDGSWGDCERWLIAWNAWLNDSDIPQMLMFMVVKRWGNLFWYCTATTYIMLKLLFNPRIVVLFLLTCIVFGVKKSPHTFSYKKNIFFPTENLSQLWRVQRLFVNDNDQQPEVLVVIWLLKPKYTYISGTMIDSRAID